MRGQLTQKPRWKIFLWLDQQCPAMRTSVDHCGPVVSCHVQIGSLTAINAEMMGTKVLTLTVFQIIVSLDHNLGRNGGNENSHAKSPKPPFHLVNGHHPSHVTLKPCMSQCNQCENKSMFDEPHLIHIICAQWICRHYLQCSWADNAIFAGQSLSHKSKKIWLFIFAIDYYHIIIILLSYYYHIIIILLSYY